MHCHRTNISKNFNNYMLKTEKQEMNNLNYKLSNALWHSFKFHYCPSRQYVAESGNSPWLGNWPGLFTRTTVVLMSYITVLAIKRFANIFFIFVSSLFWNLLLVNFVITCITFYPRIYYGLIRGSSSQIWQLSLHYYTKWRKNDVWV